MSGFCQSLRYFFSPRLNSDMSSKMSTTGLREYQNPSYRMDQEVVMFPHWILARDFYHVISTFAEAFGEQR